MKNIFAVIAAAVALMWAANTSSLIAKEKDKEVSIKGEAKCAKCMLKEAGAKECKTVIEVEKKGKTMEYYVVDNNVSKAFHEDVCHAAFERFAGRLDVRVPRIRNRLADGDAVVVEAFVAEEVVDDQRLIDPRPHVRVPGVVLAEQRFELAGLGGEVVGEGDELRVAFFDVDALLGD